MNKHERVRKAQHDAVAKLNEERERMVRFCSLDFRAIGKPGSRWSQSRQAIFDERLEKMTLAELTAEYNRRDGDHVLEHGCTPEQREE